MGDEDELAPKVPVVTLKVKDDDTLSNKTTESEI